MHNTIQMPNTSASSPLSSASKSARSSSAKDCNDERNTQHNQKKKFEKYLLYIMIDFAQNTRMLPSAKGDVPYWMLAAVTLIDI